jgi:hypothetical protein
METSNGLPRLDRETRAGQWVLDERGEKALKEAEERDERNGLASHLPADLRAGGAAPAA